MPELTLRPVTPESRDEVLAFVQAARRDLFPMLANAPVPADLEQFDDVYLQGAGAFIEARAGGVLVGVIGYLPYDNRFKQFDYGGQRVVEVVRLFVLPAYRRHGVAARLFGALKAQAAIEEIDRFYLHTHPFLPGAVSFWERQGFTLLQVEDDPIWRTTHMDLRLR
ncbi:acetyltransferase domain protein [Pseudomonas putida S610]|uniref:GNAT family N-acetyltransferase n=1 Tax=Pseudomonas putida TaxID=303 RepID=UPI0003C619A6|nr:GNAT family N-acetyltransferase [Pseudomonas putida]EST13925.1 acetyltransferase domain protein [Pseudomonas putida S610]